MKKQLLFCLSAGLLLTTTASAKIKFTDVQPDTVLAVAPSQGMLQFDIDIDKDGNTDFYVRHFQGMSGPRAEFYTKMGTTGEVAVNSSENPIALKKDDPVNSTTTNWVNKSGTMFSMALMMDATFAGVGPRYVGVRIKKGTKWHYGWIKMGVVANTNMTVYEYAINETGDEAILAGQAAPTGIDNIATEAQVNVYPNPMKDMATIETPVYNASFRLYNQYGQLVKTIETGNTKKVQLHKENLNAGNYYYDVRQGETRVAKGRLIIID